MIKVVIFDFDGTIADSFGLFIDTFRKIAPTNINNGISIDELRGMQTGQILKALKIKPRQIPLLILKGKKEMSREVSKLRTFERLPEVLRSLVADDIKLFVISSNSQTSIEKFMLTNNLDDIWTEVIGDVGLFGKAKSIKAVMKKRGYNPDEVAYVGDETRDIAAAKKAGVKSLSVSWGFNSEAILQNSKPDILLRKPKDLLESVQKL